MRARESLAELRSRALATALPPRLRRHERFDLIAEFKRHSPSAGRLGRSDVATQAKAYAQGGAAAVSVLTEPTQFGGELSHLRLAAEALAPLEIPVMRKDFIVDPYQVCETRAAGGGGVLLILRMLSQVSALGAHRLRARDALVCAARVIRRSGPRTRRAGAEREA